MEVGPRIPAPEPLESAVETGVFGWDEAGPCCPTEEQVRSLTEEHARALLASLSELSWLEHCAAQNLDPETGAPLRGELGRKRKDRIPAQVAKFRQSYADLLAVYQDAFGETAAADLDQYVRAMLRAGPQETQTLLF